MLLKVCDIILFFFHIIECDFTNTRNPQFNKWLEMMTRFNVSLKIYSRQELFIRLVLIKTQLPEDILDFLRSEGLMRQVRDYVIIPQGLKYRPKKAENIVLEG